MSRHYLRLFAFGAMLFLLLSMTAFPSDAASVPRHVVNPGTLVAPARLADPQQSTPPIHITPINVGKCCYSYVENGGCKLNHFNKTSDSIDVINTSKNPLSKINYPTVANNCATLYPGVNRLAISTKDKAHGNCLLLIDANNGSPPGYVESFVINTDGSLSQEVSHVKLGGPKGGGGIPSDIHVAGDTAYVDNPGIDFESYSVGAGCVLSFLSKTATGNTFDISIALVGSTLVTTDYILDPNHPKNNKKEIDVYTLGSGGSITFLKSTPAQFTCPWGVAVGPGPMVFTGQCTTGAPQIEGGTLNKDGSITYLKGSPASDPKGLDGAAVWYDSADGLLIQGEQKTFSLGVYSVSNGSLSFKQHTQLQVIDDQPQSVAFAQYKNTLFVVLPGSPNDEVETCVLSQSGVSGCKIVAMLTHYTDNAAGLVVTSLP